LGEVEGHPPVTKVDLTSAKAKLRWARDRRNELERHLEASFEKPETWCVMSAEYDDVSGMHVFRIAEVPDYSRFVEDISLAVGEIANGLRSALDHLAWQLANARAAVVGADERKIYFPIVNDASKFSKHQTAAFIDPSDWAEIEEYQPFKGLWGLHLTGAALVSRLPRT
jgi:hypothetical protein